MAMTFFGVATMPLINMLSAPKESSPELRHRGGHLQTQDATIMSSHRASNNANGLDSGVEIISESNPLETYIEGDEVSACATEQKKRTEWLRKPAQAA